MNQSQSSSKFSQVRETIINDRIYKWQTWALFFLTLALMLVQGTLNVPGILDGPQFTYDGTYDLTPKEDFQNFIKEAIKGNLWLKFSYYAFFVLDFFWAGILLMTTWKFVKMQFLKRSDDINDGTIETINSREKKWIRALTIVFISAYLFDVAENILYLFKFHYEAWISYTKIGLYFASGLSFLFALLSDFTEKILPVLRKFFKSSVLSLIIVAVLGMFLSTAEQVNSIIVDLYIKPWNLILLLLISPFFAIVIAHYPSYFGKGNDLKLRNWFMAAPKVLGAFGVVFYRYNKEFASEDGQEESKVNFLYRTLGIAYFSALFYMVAYASQVNFNWLLKMNTLSLVLFIAGVGFLYHIKQRKDKWYAMSFKLIKEEMSSFYDGDYSNASEEIKAGEKTEENSEEVAHLKEPDPQLISAASELRKHIWPFLWLCAITLLLHLVLFGFLFWCSDCRYSIITVVLSLISIALQMFCFVYYRAYRSLLRFTFYNDQSITILNSFSNFIDTNKWWNEMSESEKDEYIKGQQKDVKIFFTRYDFTGNHWLFKMLSKMKPRPGALSSNVAFLKINAIFGIVNVVFLLILNVFSSWSTNFSTVLIILLSLFFYYGIFVVLVKNWIYYKQTNAIGRQRFNRITTGLFVLFFALFTITRFLDNKLFTFPISDRQPKSEISLKDYTDGLDDQDRRIYIGCYGGGMKSNAWTMVVLEELFEKDSTIISDMVGISGVSGGTMGMVNWFALMKGFPGVENQERKDKLRQVATKNILSLDATHILGRDSFNYLFNPFDFVQGSDRSTKAMEIYARLSQDTKAMKDKIDYRQYWKLLYEMYDQQFPVFIANTTNVQGNQGMAVSVKVDDDMASSFLYQNADDILEIDGRLLKTEPDNPRSLSYYDAVSTSNRFPILSPAAKIETKGHFNDGGVYENSGLMSVYKLYRAIDYLEETTCQETEQKNIFISIVNDKNLYLKEVVKKLKCQPSKINYYGEFSIVLRSVASTEMMPIYIKTELERLKELSNNNTMEYHSIYLPHTFTVQDIKNVIGKELFCQTKDQTDKDLYRIVKEHNEYIKGLVNSKCKLGETPIVEPAVSRSNAEPAFDFMLNMLEHDRVKSAIEDIFD